MQMYEWTMRTQSMRRGERRLMDPASLTTRQLLLLGVVIPVDDSEPTTPVDVSLETKPVHVPERKRRRKRRHNREDHS